LPWYGLASSLSSRCTGSLSQIPSVPSNKSSNSHRRSNSSFRWCASRCLGDLLFHI
jgi:hypothetical protein